MYVSPMVRDSSLPSTSEDSRAPYPGTCALNPEMMEEEAVAARKGAML